MLKTQDARTLVFMQDVSARAATAAGLPIFDGAFDSVMVLPWVMVRYTDCPKANAYIKALEEELVRSEVITAGSGDLMVEAWGSARNVKTFINRADPDLSWVIMWAPDDEDAEEMDAYLFLGPVHFILNAAKTHA